jgi:hypothetical protein
MPKRQRNKEKGTRKQRKRLAKESAAEASQRRLANNENHRKNRAMEYEERRKLRLQREIASPGFDATVNQINDVGTLKQRRRLAKEGVAEASQRRLANNENHRKNRAIEDEERRSLRLQRDRERKAGKCEKLEIVSPGFDTAVDQFYDYVEEDPENSFTESDQTIAAGAGLLYARNGTHLYGQTLTFQLPPPTVEEVEARIERDIQRNILDGAKARAIASVVGINTLPACGACGARYNSSNDVTMQYHECDLTALPTYMVMQGDKLNTLLKEEQVRVRIPIDEKFQTMEVVRCHMRSYFRWNSVVYCLHQEYVDVDGDHASTKLCPNCYQTIKKEGDTPPRNSVASGVDFGCYQRIKQLKIPN